MKKKTKLFNYFKESVGELKRVTWPQKEEVINSTVVVILFVIVVSLFLSFFDIAVSEAVRYLFQ